MDFQSLCFKLKEIYNLYKNDEQLLNKLINHINNDLPNLLNNTKKINKERINRKLMLTEAHNDFVSAFLKNYENIYFFNPTTEIFFKYNNDNYLNIKEDDIIYNILSTISLENNIYGVKNDLKQQLIPWKYKIKTSILKNIRDNNLFDSIPSVETINSVISLFYPLIFNNENEVKYFLTILGDNILKKSLTNIYITSSHIKNILRILENCGGKYFGHIPIQNSFRYKYHGHNYDDSRLISVKNFKFNDEINELYSKNILNIYGVACHHSKLYENADNFVNKIDDINLLKHSFFLRNNSQTEIINIFINEKIENTRDSTINMKNMIYLWKCFLREKNIPNIIFSSNLKKILRETLNFKEDEEIFIDYTSPCLPKVF